MQIYLKKQSVKKNIVKRIITFQYYKNCLERDAENLIQAENYRLHDGERYLIQG